MLMPILLKRSGFGPAGLAVVMVAVLGFGLAVPTFAAAGEVYSWETADGNVAFTDNQKNVPARYRDQVRVRKTEGIEDYARFTAEDSEVTERYSDQLAKRIEYFHRSDGVQNGALARSENRGVAAITVSGIDMRLPAADTNEPIIIEKLRVQSAGQITTRHDTLVSQGGTPLAIVRGNQAGEAGGANAILDEEDIEFYR